MKAKSASTISFAVFVFAIFLIHSTNQSANWASWNSAAFTDNNFGSITPEIPSTFIRDSYSSGDRTQQYAYLLTVGVNTCRIKCGPRSFLNANSSHIFCARDTSSNFWSNLPIAVGISRPACIPDTEEINTSHGCSNLKNNGSLLNLQLGQCNSSTWTGLYSVNLPYDCCFNNINYNSTYTALVITETNSTKVAFPTYLRDNEQK